LDKTEKMAMMIVHQLELKKSTHPTSKLNIQEMECATTEDYSV